MHRRIHRCHSCGTSYGEKATMSVHLREHYGHSIPQLQFDALLDLCDRAMPDTEHKGEHCRFCGKTISLDEAQDHLGSHMETLALFVLPNNDDIEEGVASENSIQAELSDPESGTNDGKSEKSNLSIYVPESPKPSFSFFTDALPVDEMDIVSKFAAWSVEEDERNPINVRGITEHGKSSAVYACTLCNKTFTRKFHQRDHELSHRGQLPHECPECGRAFTRLNDMKRHQKIHERK
jgi:uncharacterized Zn-finger protein